jgi:Na+-transporting NADH:ubiquinone oxidoreductase subunit B
MDHRFPIFAAHRASGDQQAQILDVLGFLMSGSLLYAAVFMSTDPVSAPKKPLALIAYGLIIGGLTIVIRVFAGFPEGVSFAILTANTFACLLDEVLPAKKKKSAPRSVAPVAAGGVE